MSKTGNRRQHRVFSTMHTEYHLRQDECVGVRDRAEQNLDVVRQTYELGSKTLLDYIAEHHRYIEIENGFVDAQLEAYLAMVEILKVTNDPNLK